jgi:hypothetical protein
MLLALDPAAGAAAQHPFREPGRSARAAGRPARIVGHLGAGAGRRADAPGRRPDCPGVDVRWPGCAGGSCQHISHGASVAEVERLGDRLLSIPEVRVITAAGNPAAARPRVVRSIRRHSTAKLLALKAWVLDTPAGQASASCPPSPNRRSRRHWAPSRCCPPNSGRDQPALSRGRPAASVGPHRR